MFLISNLGNIVTINDPRTGSIGGTHINTRLTRPKNSDGSDTAYVRILRSVNSCFKKSRKDIIHEVFGDELITLWNGKEVINNHQIDDTLITLSRYGLIKRRDHKYTITKWGFSYLYEIDKPGFEKFSKLTNFIYQNLWINIVDLMTWKEVIRIAKLGTPEFTIDPCTYPSIDADQFIHFTDNTLDRLYKVGSNCKLHIDKDLIIFSKNVCDSTTTIKVKDRYLKEFSKSKIPSDIFYDKWISLY